MAETETEAPQQLSIQARIAALKLDQVGKNPSSSKSPPPLPVKPPANRAASAVVLPTIGDSIGNEPNGDVVPPLPRRREKPPPPSLPPRRDSGTPSLPSRRPSELSKRDSQESISSVISAVSNVSNAATRTGYSRPSMDAGRVKAPVYDPNTLPPLPPSRRGQDAEIRANGKRPDWRAVASKSTSNVSVIELSAPVGPNLPVLPSRPSNPSSPALPQRPNSSTTPILPQRPVASPSLPQRPSQPSLPHRPQTTEPQLPARRLPPTIIPPVNPRTPDLPQRPRTNGSDAPPPIPSATRPDLGSLLATKPKLPVSQPAISQAVSHIASTAPISLDGAGGDYCMACRDFSGPDNHAARFPRQDVPYLGWLAEQLTAPFPSQTDKARAIFTWLHHNIDYNAKDFFAKSVKGSTPAGTIESGLAVCEGYAGLFAALATSAGMEAIVVGGHGKGYGISNPKPGSPCPPKDFNHAWNAVKIDGGEWKLLDACWGAGYIGDDKLYHRKFNPSEFTKSNDLFGVKHFPQDSRHFYRADGRTPSWEEYFMDQSGSDPHWVFMDDDEGFSRASFKPDTQRISRNPRSYPGPTLRFQFTRICEHWNPKIHGKNKKPYLYLLETQNGDPQDQANFSREFHPFDNDGFFWWVDVPVGKLGKSGSNCLLAAVDKVNGHDARGITKEEYLNAKGRQSMGWRYFAKWEVVA